MDGFRMHISGRTGNNVIFKGAEQLNMSKENEEGLKHIGKYINRVKMARERLPINDHDGINGDGNLVIYDEFINKLENTVYNVRLSAQIKCFSDGRDIFELLDLPEQCKLLMNALNLFQCNSVSADLSLIGGGAHCGIIKPSKEMSKAESVNIINQSVTGLFEQQMDLLKL